MRPSSRAATTAIRAYLTIIEGCDQRCAFCVVPMTRGPERSRSSAKILAECRRLVDEGYTEIQLLGQIVNAWRDPSPAGWSFADLLARVAEVPGVRRVRFTTSHPRYFTPEIVQAIDSHPTLCDQIHLPVQAGSTDSPGTHAARLFARRISGENPLHPQGATCY